MLQVNVSAGGVPKRPVAEAWVDHLGLTGDAHHDDTEHGGPHRAVALYALEAIRRVQADGHPISPGSAGENLTTTGIELAALPVGTRLAIGERLVLELAKPDNPCKTIAANFTDGRFARISIATHPLDSRMYARVLTEGPVRPGDAITVLPPAPGSSAQLHELLDLIESVEQHEALFLWRGARAAGHTIHILEDGDLAAAAAPGLDYPAFNRAYGLRQLPNLVDRLTAFYRSAGTNGYLVAADPPWPGAVGVLRTNSWRPIPQPCRRRHRPAGSISAGSATATPTAGCRPPLTCRRRPSIRPRHGPGAAPSWTGS